MLFKLKLSSILKVFTEAQELLAQFISQEEIANHNRAERVVEITKDSDEAQERIDQARKVLTQVNTLLGA